MSASSSHKVQRDKLESHAAMETSYGFWQLLSPFLLTILKFLTGSLSWMRRFLNFGESRHSGRPPGLSHEKAKFLKEYGKEYGFPEGPISIDELRSKEFSRLGGTVYLDHAGATLYTQTQLQAVLDDLSANLYGNPHSQSESSTLSTDVIDRVRSQVLAMCKASSDEYACVFTSGATGALKLVGETFPWSGNSQFMYTMENHNSVLGIREYALNHGASVTPVYVDCTQRETSEGSTRSRYQVRKGKTQRRASTVARDQGISSDTAQNLFACPLECNFSGAKVDLGIVSFVQKAHHMESGRGKWLVLLDAAKGCSTAPPNLSLFKADFVAVSFYKIFGYPTGLGALLIRKDATPFLKKDYFGGGTVAVAAADDDYVERRSRIEQKLEDGTVSFLGIASLRHGFHVIDRLQMAAINRHTGCLASYTVARLDALRHYNGAKVCVLYGNHDMVRKNRVKYWGSSCEQGPVISFNLKRADGSWIGPREVEKLAMLSAIHLRTGCFCNPGACFKYLGLSSHKMKENFEAGHVCWDDKDLISGYPTGAVRVSFGYMNTFEDCWAFLQFIFKFFVEHHLVPAANPRVRSGPREIGSCRSSTVSTISEGPVCLLKAITIYPIKSCGGFTSNAWPLGDTGLLYDREWLVMSRSGEVLTQKRCPDMSSVQTFVDLESGSLRVQALNMKSVLAVPLMQKATCNVFEDVCLPDDPEDECGQRANEWFSMALGIPCLLVNKNQKRQMVEGSEAPATDSGNKVTGDERAQRSFANEAQLLLVSQDSVEDLNHRLLSRDSKPGEGDQTSTSGRSKLRVDAARFRPNLVVSGALAYDEDYWQTLVIGDQQFQVMGGCNRCKMVNIDQTTGKCLTASEPLITLASYRRVKEQPNGTYSEAAVSPHSRAALGRLTWMGRIYFGVLLEQDREATSNLASGKEKKDFGSGQGSPTRCDSNSKRTLVRMLKVGQRLQVVKQRENVDQGLSESTLCFWQRDSTIQ